MEKEEIKKIVAGLLNNGETLNSILKILSSEHKVPMTFLELRLLASEMEEIDWTKTEEPDPKPEKDKGDDISSDGELADASAGKTVVEINRLARPGLAMHGSVKFASGASAGWILDQMGRFGFEKTKGSPTQEDIQDFQRELKKALGA
ncbi:MAG: hypothetical protein JW808_06315 [Victivallales bacterium]|nr:hypothetical protein [Victivallales bacterium]